MRKIFLILALALLTITAASAQSQPQHILSNSADWRDVYSTTIYANLQNIPSNFLTSTRHSTIILFSIPTSKQYIQAITSSDQPYVVGYEDILQSRGYSQAEELVFDNVNLELARLLPNVNKFIITDSSYGYNALSAAPYAVEAGYYVLFVNELNVGEVENFLLDRGVDDMIVLGRVDRDVRETMDQFNPEVINEGDRFDNNLAMVDKFLTIKDSRQAILTNGEFLEQSIMSGTDPVMFIGRANVPDKVRTYIRNSDIDVGILIGNELIGAATFIRRQVGISVFVKFAQGSRSPTGPIAQVEDLDRFPMPRFELDLSIENIVYNRATGSLEVTFSNNVDLASYFKSTLTITNNEDGSIITTAGDETAIFIDGGDLKTVTYDIDLPNVDANASVFTIYGEATDSLENELERTVSIDYVEVRDDSKINITDLAYDTGEDKFYITIKNVGDVRTFVDVELVELMINEERVTIGADEIIELQAGEKSEIPVTVEMEEADIVDNEVINVRARYGERRLALIKESQAQFEFREKKADYLYYALIAAIIILLFLLFKRRKKDEKK